MCPQVRASFMSETHIHQGFRALDLSPKLHDLLDRLGFVTPTPIQEQAIPAALTGHDLIGLAQTGTGKTLAFTLPIIRRLKDLDGPALILVPTRELALQVHETVKKIADQFGIKSAVLIGGAPMGKQISQLRARPSIVIATPGRLIDHMQQRTLHLGRTRIVVLDEADRMLDMGFLPAIQRILRETPDARQTMLFSATMPDDIAQLASEFLVDPVRIEIERAGTVVDLVSQELYMVEHEEKGSLLKSLLDSNDGTVLVFSRTRHGARKVAKAVRDMGHTAAEIHSDRTLAQRRLALEGFKSGHHRVLVATDIAARGIDVKEIALVINYDLPDNPEDYVHRIGRTGRAGVKGRALTFAMPKQVRDVMGIEKITGSEIPLADLSPMGISRPVIHRPKPNSRKKPQIGRTNHERTPVRAEDERPISPRYAKPGHPKQEGTRWERAPRAESSPEPRRFQRGSAPSPSDSKPDSRSTKFKSSKSFGKSKPKPSGDRPQSFSDRVSKSGASTPKPRPFGQAGKGKSFKKRSYR